MNSSSLNTNCSWATFMILRNSITDMLLSCLVPLNLTFLGNSFRASCSLLLESSVGIGLNLLGGFTALFIWWLLSSLFIMESSMCLCDCCILLSISDFSNCIAVWKLVQSSVMLVSTPLRFVFRARAVLSCASFISIAPMGCCLVKRMLSICLGS